jgi:hypothetical protein
MEKFIIDLRDFAYYSIYKSKGEVIANKFYRSQFKYLVGPYFVSLLLGQSALFYKANIEIPDIADGNVLIMIVVGGIVIVIYNVIMIPIERIYDRFPIDIDTIKYKYNYIKKKMIVFFIVGLALIPLVPYSIITFL